MGTGPLSSARSRGALIVAAILAALVPVAVLDVAPASALGSSTVVFTSASTGTVGVAYTAAAHGTAGDTGAITYTKVSDGDGCAVAGTSVTFTAAQDCVIRATQAADSNYGTASADLTISVGKGESIVEFDSPDTGTVGVTYQADASAAPSTGQISFSKVSGDGCELNDGTVTFSTTEDCVLRATQVADDNYNETYTDLTITVSKGTSTITWDSGTGGTVGEEYTAAAHGPTGATGAITFTRVSGSGCDLSGTTVTFTTTEDCVLRATQAGDDNYQETSVDRTIAVSEGISDVAPEGAGQSGLEAIKGVALPITLANTDIDGTDLTCSIIDQPFSGSVVLSGDAPSTDCSASYTAAFNTAGSDSFSYQVSDGILESDIYTVSLSIPNTAPEGADQSGLTTPANQDLVIDLANSDADGDSVACTLVDASNPGAVTLSGSAPSSDCTATVNTPDVGTFSFSYEVTDGYAVSSTYTVTGVATKTPQTITFPTFATVIGSTATLGATTTSPLTVAYSTSGAGCASLDGPHLTFSSIAGLACTVTASQPGDGVYSPATAVVRKIKTVKVPQTIQFAQPTGAFGVPDTGSLNPTSLTITDEDAHSLAPNSDLGVLISTSGTACASTSATSLPVTVTFTAGGTCIVTASQPGDVTRAAATSVKRTVTVAKTAQVIHFDQPTGPFGVAETGSANPSSLTISATDASATLPNATASPKGVLVATSGAACATTAATALPVTITFTAGGTCSITASQPGDTRYAAATLVKRTVTVAKTAQAIHFDQPTGPFGVTGSGTDDPTSLTIDSSAAYATLADHADTPTFSVLVAASGVACGTHAAAPVPVTITFTAGGTCAITVTQPGNTQYAAAVAVKRTVTALKVGQLITLAATPGPYGVGGTGSTATTSLTIHPDDVTVTLPSQGDLPSPITAPTVSTSGTACATQTGVSLPVTIDFTAAGKCSISVAQGGNDSFNAATTVKRSITVAGTAQAITFAQPTGPFGVPGTHTADGTKTSVTITSDDAYARLPNGDLSPLGVKVATSGTACAPTTATDLPVTITFTAGGSCAVTVSRAAQGNYASASSVKRTITVPKTAQAVQGFSTASTTGHVGGTVSLTGVTTTSGLAIVVTGTAGKCTPVVTDGVVTGVSLDEAGSCTIKVSQPGDALWAAATSLSRKITIS